MSYSEKVDQAIAMQESELRKLGLEPGLFGSGFHAGVAWALTHQL